MEKKHADNLFFSFRKAIFLENTHLYRVDFTSTYRAK